MKKENLHGIGELTQPYVKKSFTVSHRIILYFETERLTVCCYRKELKCVTTFNVFTFCRAG